MSTATMLAHTSALTRRSLLGRLRQPAVLAPSFIFPLFFAALGTASFSRAGKLPDFPAPSFLNYAVAGAILQGILFGATSAASDMAVDIEQGFFERLLSSPVSRTAIVVGRLGSGVLIAMFQVVLFLTVFIVFGADVTSGPLGVIGLIGGGGILALAVSSLMATFAIRSGSAEVVQGAFPLMFILMFLSSAFYPRQYFSGWYATVAKWNPISHIVEGMQSFMNSDLEASAFARAWGISAAAAAVGVVLCLRAMRRRLASM